MTKSIKNWLSANAPGDVQAFVNANQLRLTAQAETIASLRLRLLSAAGDDLCRLTQEEIKELSSGAVKIPPKEEFLASCERFHAQIAAGPGVLSGCLTLAQLIAENERLREQLAVAVDQNNLLRAALADAEAPTPMAARRDVNAGAGRATDDCT